MLNEVEQIGIDWAGIVLERVTGRPLNKYIEENIFNPLQLNRISMTPSEEMKAKLAYMHQRDENGKVSARDHLLRRPLTFNDESEGKLFASGGAGCFSTAQDYCRILAVLLNDGTCPKTQTHLLKRETIDEMFKDQISHLTSLREIEMPSAKTEIFTAASEVHPTVAEDRQGLTFMLSGGVTGRPIGTAQWSGLPNLRWWCDRVNGVAGIVCTQVLPFGDKTLFDLSQDVEREVYSSLNQGGST